MKTLTESESRYLASLIAAEIERIEQHEIGQPYYLTDLAIATALRDKLVPTTTTTEQNNS